MWIDDPDDPLNSGTWPPFMLDALNRPPSGQPIGASTRVHSPSKTGVDALMNAPWPDPASVNARNAGISGGLAGQILTKMLPPAARATPQQSPAWLAGAQLGAVPASPAWPQPLEAPAQPQSPMFEEPAGRAPPASLDLSDPFAVAAYRQRNAVRRGAPLPQADPTQANVGDDVFKSGGIGVVKGGIGTLGAGGDTRELTRSLVDWVAAQASRPTLMDLIAPDEPRRTTAGDIAATIMTKLPGLGPLYAGPTSEQIQRAIEGVTGEFYKPKTTAGEFAQTGGEFASSLLGGKGGAARRVAQWVGSTLGAEGASRLAEALNLPAVAPYAKVAGGLAGGIIPGLVPRRAAPTPPGGKPAPQMNVVEEPAPSPSPSQGPIAVTLHEQAPGVDTGHLRGVLDLPYAERLKYTGNAWNVPGTKRDAIHEALGIVAEDTRPATGSFRGETNPAHASPMRVNAAGESVAGPAGYEAGEKLRAVFSGQHGVGWQALIRNAEDAAQTSVRIPHQGPLDPAKASHRLG